MIVGIDEVGRGPWAGPLVFGAVVLGGEAIDGLTDSKKLTKKRRIELDKLIRDRAVSFGLGWVSAEEIDEVGMSEACALGCRRALEQITTPYHEIVIDGTVNFLKNTGKGPYATTMKQADLLVPSVSAASILAKVARDNYMVEQDETYPGYSFGSHVGYGTAAHRLALEKLGITPLHRKSFAPVAQLIGDYPSSEDSREGIPCSDHGQVTTRGVGDASESVAADYLQKLGYEIVERNWKTKVCEIDIVVAKDDTLYFVEVKHRKNDRQGGGVAAITNKKLKQMTFAAKVYAHHTRQDDADMRLAVITTQGTDFSSVELLILQA